MSAYIRIRCPKCNYLYSTYVYGYVEDPIGVPLTQCPRCNNISKDSKRKEWIQMSPIKKYFSISPRSNILSTFLALIPMIILSCNNIEVGKMFLGVLIVSWIIADYIVISIRVNCRSCLDRIISSISRTNNESYAQHLSKLGKIYGNSIPKVLFLSKSNRASFEHAIKTRVVQDIVIPTFSDSINNC